MYKGKTLDQIDLSDKELLESDSNNSLSDGDNEPSLEGMQIEYLVSELHKLFSKFLFQKIRSKLIIIIEVISANIIIYGTNGQRKRKSACNIISRPI